jgi:hypothetical protein
MANTELADIFVPEVFRTYQVNDAVEKTAFVESGVVRLDPVLNQRADSGGLLTTIPFWNDLDATIEPNYSNTTYTDVAEPQKITSGEMTARVSYLNEGFSSSDLNKELAGSDPMVRIAARLDSYWQRQFQRRIIAIAIGLYNDNIAANAGDMVLDVSSTTPGTITAANRFTAGGLIDAQYTLGDRGGELGVIALHSVIYKKMLKDDLIDFVVDSQGKLTLPTYLGMRIVVDDGMPSTGTGVDRKYICVVFGPGAIGYGTGNPKMPEELSRYAERANGGGVGVLWTRKTWLIHPGGYDFLSTSITAPGLSPTWANLNNAVNWERKIDRKNIQMAFYVVNA